MLPSIYLTDEAFSLVEPILARIAPRYHPDTRWGLAEIGAEVWREAAHEFKNVAARLNSGSALKKSDVAWVHTVDLDSGVETSADTFLQQMESAEAKKTIATFLLSLADWIHGRIQHEAVLTIYGY